jgi:ribonuclease-3
MMTQASGLDALERALDHRFADRALLVRALTHPSVARAGSYELLEFLGDRVLGLVVARLLLDRYPDEPEGAIGRRFAMLVREETLAEIGRTLGVADHIRAGAGVLNDSIVADVIESLIAAMYRDGGLAPAEAFVKRHWEPLVVRETRPPRDAKTALQEWTQSQARGLPVYSEVARSGPDHAPEFTIQVHIEGLAPVRATGTSKRAAERAAAAIMLDMLGIETHG